MEITLDGKEDGRQTVSEDRQIVSVALGRLQVRRFLIQARNSLLRGQFESVLRPRLYPAPCWAHQADCTSEDQCRG